MDLKKAEDFVTRICDKTSSGELKWEKTPDSTIFQAKIANFVVRFALMDERGNSYRISLFDNRGEELDSYTNDDFDVDQRNGRISYDMRNRMRGAYDDARRQVNGVEKALDDILGELG